VDAKQQFEGDHQFGMVDEVLETLMHRHPAKRVKPSESTMRETELSD
jgi:hypothetical protein